MFSMANLEKCIFCELFSLFLFLIHSGNLSFHFILIFVHTHFLRCLVISWGGLYKCFYRTFALPFDSSVYLPIANNEKKLNVCVIETNEILMQKIAKTTTTTAMTNDQPPWFWKLANRIKYIQLLISMAISFADSFFLYLSFFCLHAHTQTYSHSHSMFGCNV